MPRLPKKVIQQAKIGRPRLNEPRKVVFVRVSEKLHQAYLERGGARWLKRVLDGLV